jgi:hypothetical protein
VSIALTQQTATSAALNTNNDFTVTTPACPTGTVVTGGGYSTSIPLANGGITSIQYLGPVGTTQWRIAGRVGFSGGGTHTVTAIAICG